MRIVIVIAIIMLCAQTVFASPDAELIINNIEKNDHQSVQVGRIDSLTIVRGNAVFKLNDGILTLFDFGSGRVCAMTYNGTGEFAFVPPNDIERDQLKKFTGKSRLEGPLTRATFFFTLELDQMPDTSQFKRITCPDKSWKQLQEAFDEEFDHLWVNSTSVLMQDLLSPGPGTYFNAIFEFSTLGLFVFEENPLKDDYYFLYMLVRYAGMEIGDIINGYSPDEDLPSMRGVIPIDISHYDIDSRIEGDGDMLTRCRVTFMPLRSERRFIYFNWYYRNEIESVTDWNGDTLAVVRRTDKSGLFTGKGDEPGFGVIMKEPLELGKSYFIDIVFKCHSLIQEYDNFYIRNQTQWYPRAQILDLATFDISFNTPKAYRVVCCGDNIEFKTENGRAISRWRTPNPVEFVSFNMGDFFSKEIDAPGLPSVKAFASKNIPHDSISLNLLEYYGISSNSDVAGIIAGDIANSVSFYTALFGPCPFDTIRVSELYSRIHQDEDNSYYVLTKWGQGSPGLIHLSWGSFQYNMVEGLDTELRAHEAAHQWWGHLVTNESYRDTWIIEGLSEYCGFWFYEASKKNRTACDRILNYWRTWIMTGNGPESFGSSTGPITLGGRLTSTIANDYGNLVYEKGAYVFHMIRYLLHDYKTGSDDAFAAFLRDLALKFRGKAITTEKLQALLEEHVGEDMSWFFKQWIYGTEIPVYSFSSTTTATRDGKYQVVCHVRQSGVRPDFKMLVPITVSFDDDKYINLRVWVDKPDGDIKLPILPYKPKKIIFNSYDAVLCKVKYEL